MEKRIILNSILRTRLDFFIHRCFQTVVAGERFSPNWHIQAMAHHLTQCLEGRIKRLLITLPPRNLKSLCSTVGLPAFALGLDPTKKIICVSYSQDLSSKHTRHFRTILQSPWYMQLFRNTRIHPQKNTESEIETTAGGFRLASSIDGTLTGRGGSIIIIDDPLKPQDAMSEPRRKSVQDWFYNTLYSRLDNKNEDVIILLMQRIHVDDLVGFVLETEPWIHINFPAIAEEAAIIPIGDGEFYERKAGEVLHPERESFETLMTLKKNIGSFNFSAQYQQNPIPPEGNLIKWKWFKTYNERPTREGYDQIVQSWDTASKPGELNDYSVCITFLVKEKDFFILDIMREKLNFPNLEKRVVSLYKKFEADSILIEDRSSGTQLIQALREKGIVRPISIDPEGDKIIRMSAQSSKIEAGQVYLPKDAHWLPEFRKEVLQFPNGKHDDQVDAMSQFLGWMRPYRTRLIAAGGQRTITRDWPY